MLARVYFTMVATSDRRRHVKGLASDGMLRVLALAFSLTSSGCQPDAGTQAHGVAATKPSEPHKPAIATTQTMVNTQAPAVPDNQPEIWLQPYGPVADDVLQAARDGLMRAYGFAVHMRSPLPLPEDTYYKPRKRYRAHHLVAYLKTLIERQCRDRCYVLGITSSDISIPSGVHPDWGVFGFALISGPAAIISTHRLAKKHPERSKFLHRVSVAAVHEIGHTFGLSHCTEVKTRCPMRDAEGSITITDDSELRLGPNCSEELEGKYRLGRGYLSRR